MNLLTPSSGSDDGVAAHTALREKYDTAKFTDHEIENELNNIPPRHRSEAYLTALRAEMAHRAFGPVTK